MRCGLTEELGPSVTASFTAIDMNEFCNEVYRTSFGDQPLSRDICSIPLDWFETLCADIWTMSPPCQPYTRQGNQHDAEDDRAKPLTYLTHEILAKLRNLPRHIILENVKNFETSVSFNELVKVLHSRGYMLRGFLLNPLYMGFPNSRLRFFLVATLTGQPNDHVPIVSNDPLQCTAFEQIVTPPSLIHGTNQIGDYLCKDHGIDLRVPKSILEKKAAFCFDIVSAESTQCLCFTRAYTKFIDGTGSVLMTHVPEDCAMDEKSRPILRDMESMTELYGKLRYFCPTEAARLNGFKVNEPGGLRFPSDCFGGKKYYRAVGNSLNPQVVAFLVRNVGIS